MKRCRKRGDCNSSCACALPRGSVRSRSWLRNPFFSLLFFWINE